MATVDAGGSGPRGSLLATVNIPGPDYRQAPKTVSADPVRTAQQAYRSHQENWDALLNLSGVVGDHIKYKREKSEHDDTSSGRRAANEALSFAASEAEAAAKEILTSAKGDRWDHNFPNVAKVIFTGEISARREGLSPTAQVVYDKLTSGMSLETALNLTTNQYDYRIQALDQTGNVNRDIQDMTSSDVVDYYHTQKESGELFDPVLDQLRELAVGGVDSAVAAMGALKAPITEDGLAPFYGGLDLSALELSRRVESNRDRARGALERLPYADVQAVIASMPPEDRDAWLDNTQSLVSDLLPGADGAAASKALVAIGQEGRRVDLLNGLVSDFVSKGANRTEVLKHGALAVPGNSVYFTDGVLSNVPVQDIGVALEDLVARSPKGVPLFISTDIAIKMQGAGGAIYGLDSEDFLKRSSHKIRVLEPGSKTGSKPLSSFLGYVEDPVLPSLQEFRRRGAVGLLPATLAETVTTEFENKPWLEDLFLKDYEVPRGVLKGLLIPPPHVPIVIDEEDDIVTSGTYARPTREDLRHLVERIESDFTARGPFRDALLSSMTSKTDQDPQELTTLAIRVWQETRVARYIRYKEGR